MAYNLKIIDVSIDDLNYRLDYSSFDTVSLTSTPTNHNTECLSVNDRIDSIDSIDSQSNYDQPLLGVSSNEIDNKEITDTKNRGCNCIKLWSILFNKNSD